MRRSEIMSFEGVKFINYVERMLNFYNISSQDIASIDENLGNIYLELQNGKVYCIGLINTGE
jgi:hypothetical protein